MAAVNAQQREPRFQPVGIGKRDVAAEFAQRHVAHVDHRLPRRCPGGIDQVGDRNLRNAQSFLIQSAREEDVSGAALAGHDVVRDRHVAPLQPEAVPLVAEILLRDAAIDVFARAVRMNGDVAVERADFVAGLGHDTRPPRR